MKAKFIRDKGRLAIGYTPKGAEKPFILAAATLHEGTGCWQIVDIRLTRFCVPSEYSCSLIADDITAVFSPRTTEEADIAKSMLREYREVPVTNNPSLPPRIVWCTFDGILRGHPSVGGYSPKRHFDFEQAGYFSYKEVLRKLAEIQSSWGDFTGDPRTFRLANPDRQPSLIEVIGKVVSKGILSARQQLAPEHANKECGDVSARDSSALQYECNNNNERDDVDEEIRSHTP